MKHLAISPEEAGDRLAIRELVEAYAHCADRREAKGQMSLFTADTHFVVFMNAKDPKPSMELHSREALAPVFADLNKYDATTHFVVQSTIFTLTADRATGEVYCLAHHVTVDGVIPCEEHAVMRMFLSVSLPIVVTPLLQAQLDLRQIKLNELLSVVQLYKALGGGWQS